MTATVDRVWVVPHTHWDREWYLTLEDFRMRLGVTVDQILDVLAADPIFRFSLDGQAVVLEDYFEIRPERQAELIRFVSEGRITVGPMYTLPDEYLVGQEALVRNLLLGRQTCWRYGARPMPVGYLPDTFGHVAQMPQVLRGFGLDSFVFTRGYGDEGDELGAAFRWLAPDGSSVLALHQLDGYGNGHQLGRRAYQDDPAGDVRKGAENVFAHIDKLLGMYGDWLDTAGVRDLLLCNGMDHEPIEPWMTDLLGECAQRQPERTWRMATYEDVVAALRPLEPQLAEWSGELCGGLKHNVLRGVNSARMYLKQDNERTERELAIAEALASLAWMQSGGGYRYPSGELRLAWRELLRNHPHDSICGCSVDEVHDDMHQRFLTAEQIARRVQRGALGALAGQGDPWSYEPLHREGHVVRSEWADGFTLVNPLPVPRTAMIELELQEDALPASGDAVAVTEEGQRLPLQLDVPSTNDGRRRRAFVAARLGSFGSLGLRIEAAADDAADGTARAVDERTIENEHYRVRAQGDGSFTIEDVATGQRWERCGYLEDVGDRGDEYTFDPVGADAPLRSTDATVTVSVSRRGPVVAELTVALVLELPEGVAGEGRDARADRLVQCPVELRARLVAGIDRVEFTAHVDNRAADHRLRVRFPAGGKLDDVRVEGHFLTVRRPAQPPAPEHWFEPPHTTHHTIGAVAAGDMAVFTKGLPEYEVLPDGNEVAVTLLRCVGWLSRDDLATRNGGAGPQLPTPGGQCIGRHVFEYAVRPGREHSDAGLANASHDYRFGLVCGPAGIGTNDLLRLDAPEVSFAALKGAEDGQGVVLRLYNPGAEPATLELDGAFTRAHRSRMDETVAAPDPGAPAELAAGEVATLRLR